MERNENKMVDTESEQQIIDALHNIEKEYKISMAKNPHDIRSIVRRKYCLKWEKLRINGYI